MIAGLDLVISVDTALIHLAGFVALISLVAAVSLYELTYPLPLFGNR